MTGTLVKIEEEVEDAQRGKYLAFSLGGETYGMEIQYVTEIVGMQKIIPFPGLPDYMKGIINLRGRVIPVMDMHLRLKQEPVSYTYRTSIIIVTTAGTSVGLIVDRVKEVLSADDRSVTPPPEWKAEMRGGCIKGIGKSGGDIWLLLDCERLIGCE